MSFRLLSLMILSSLILSGCSKIMPTLDKVLPDQRKEYEKSKSLPDLEVPPDLTTETIDDSLSVPDVDEGGSATFSTYQERVVRQKENRQFSASGASDASGVSDVAGEQLFVVSGSSSDTWIGIQEFWASLGYSIDLNDEELGVMETNWSGDEASQKRDKFKVFIEPADSGKTAVYLSHKGESFDDDIWAERDRDTPLERKVAVRLQSALGGTASTAIAADPVANASDTERDTASESSTSVMISSELVNAGEDKVYLAVKSDIDNVWPKVGAFLNNASDISVEDENQSSRTFEIKYQIEETEKKSIVSKLAFWKGDNDEFQISLTSVGKKTEIVVLDDDGEWDTSGAAAQILSRIKDNL